MSQRKLRLGFIGAGWWAAEYQMPWFAARDDVALVSVCRLGQAELTLVRERFGFAHATEDYRELLAQELDAVVVASPHILHYEHARAALEAGLHVMVEKPMCTRARDARALAGLAAAKGLHVLVPQGWNFTPYVRQARRLTQAGAIGEVRHIVCQMASALADLMAGRPMIETEGQTFRPPPTTWADPARAGGYGWGQLTHALGVMFALADVQPATVTAQMGHSPSGADYYDAIIATFTNGATAAISGSATIPKPSGARHDRSKGYQIDIRIFGTEGMLLLDIERERLEIRRNDGHDTVVPMRPGDGDYPASAPWQAFVDLVLGRSRENAMPADLAVKTVEVVEAAYRSANEGGRLVNVFEL
ncbi:MAG: Gfo/Idh/MocA family oxidoreductase [Anaerolineae bacterium]|nr:Gfo/Idh/MocA family oxidoreductase [Anaerolineae bacterium]